MISSWLNTMIYFQYRYQILFFQYRNSLLTMVWFLFGVGHGVFFSGQIAVQNISGNTHLVCFHFGVNPNVIVQVRS